MAFRESQGTPGSGIMMGMDGAPMMSGTWVNPKTGHKFTVQDCFFQDGNFMVQTTDGRMLDYNTIQHYVQTTDKGPEIGKQPQKPTKKKQKAQPIQESLPDDIMNEILPEDMEAIGLGNINDTIRNDGYIGTALSEPNKSSAITAQRPTPQVDPDVVMIEKVLKKHSMPEPQVSIDWQPVPTKQMETLVDILGVEPRAIADYYINKIDMTKLIKTVKDAIVDCVGTIVGGMESPEAVEIVAAPVEVEEKPKKTTKKKSTKKSKK